MGGSRKLRQARPAPLARGLSHRPRSEFAPAEIAKARTMEALRNPFRARRRKRRKNHADDGRARPESLQPNRGDPGAQEKIGAQRIAHRNRHRRNFHGLRLRPRGPYRNPESSVYAKKSRRSDRARAGRNLAKTRAAIHRAARFNLRYHRWDKCTFATTRRARWPRYTIRIRRCPRNRPPSSSEAVRFFRRPTRPTGSARATIRPTRAHRQRRRNPLAPEARRNSRAAS